MRNNQKGIVHIIIAVVVLIALAALLYLKVRSTSNLSKQAANTMPVPTQYQQTYNAAASNVPEVQNSGDLNKTSADLETTNTTQLDTDLNAINSASNF